MRSFKIICTLILLLSGASAQASGFEFESEGFIYRVIDENARSLEVVRPIENFSEIIIPGNILRDGKKYTVKHIATSAFKRKIGGYSVKLPNTLESIGDSAFYSSTLLSIELPNSLLSIGEVAFSNCHQLKSIHIPKSLVTIASHAFLFCRSMEEYSVDNENIAYSATDGILYDKNQTELVWYPSAKSTGYTIPQTVNSIGEYAFTYNTLKSITFPSHIKTIKAYAFYNSRELTSISIPSSISEIGRNAFARCDKLTNVTIPASVTSMGDAICRGCFNLKEIIVDENNPNYTSINGVLFNKEMTILLNYPCSRTEKYEIPNSVETIGKGAFEYGRLTAIDIPTSVKNIGWSAFYGCGMLTNVDLPNSVVEIEPYAFSSTGIVNMTIPVSISSIPHHTFDGCMNLESISLPTTLNTIEPNTFSRCGKLTSIQIPSSVRSIGNDAFNYCKSLSSIVIPSSTQSIGERAFNGCTNLNAIIIPNSVESVGPWSFSNCSNLTTVTLPNSLKMIGTCAFFNSPNLNEINYISTDPIECNPSFSDNVLINCKLNIPLGTINTFNRIDPWRNFFNIEEKEFSQSGIDEIFPSDESYSVYTINGIYVSSSLHNLPPGAYLIKRQHQVSKVYISK